MILQFNKHVMAETSGEGEEQVRKDALRAKKVADEAFGLATPPETYIPETTMVLGGSFGTAEPPKLVSFLPYDLFNADPTFNDGDGFELLFDVYTTMSGQLGNKEQVDAIFGFSSSLGQQYSGLWSVCHDEETATKCKKLTITVLDSGMGMHRLSHSGTAHGNRAAARSVCRWDGTRSSRSPCTSLNCAAEGARRSMPT